ncbi:MAG: DUF58 domain-containing protein [Gammaproteobacteria bacterium]|nr:DUF58 domain-containing protein [Gammaproteobacteria bacterium]MCF6230564.1 DUF58 domain-containing protein [Gammaproteobacteria bacterium]
MSLSARLNLARFFTAKEPESGTITLTQRRIYILPTRAGVSFGMILLAMFLAAINYNNSLAYLLTFLLTSVTIVSMLHCFRNLQGLQLRARTPQAAFAGESLELPLHLYNPSPQRRLAIKLGWPKERPQQVDLNPQQGEWINLELPALPRGRHPIGRITLYTRFPLGFFHAWSYLHFDVSALVYPKPSGTRRLPDEPFQQQGSEGDRGRGSDDFIGQRPYHPGDSLHHLNWKALARERGLLTKQFGGDRSDELKVSWQLLTEQPTEVKLSQLCRWVIEAEQGHLRYGLEIPGAHIPVGQGQQHYEQCLSALALYGQKS